MSPAEDDTLGEASDAELNPDAPECGALEEGEIAKPAEGDASAPLSVSEHPILAGAKILVVDDSRTLRSQLANTLGSAKAVVDSAEDGKQALDHLRKARQAGHPFALMMTDLSMPNMSGLDLLRAVRSDPELRTTPVVVISTESERKVILECAKFGISSYLIKPSPTKRILEACEQALEASGHGKKSEAEESHPGGGLSLGQAKGLRQALLAAAKQAADAGVPAGTPPEQEPVYQTAMAFLRRHCPEAAP